MWTMRPASAATPQVPATEGTVISGDLDATDADGLTDTTYFTIKTQGRGAAPRQSTPKPGAWTFTPTGPDWFGFGLSSP